jgi:hypothetical protein
MKFRSTILPLITATLLTGCSGSTNDDLSPPPPPPPPNPAAEFTSDPTLLGAVSDAQNRGSVYLREIGVQATPQAAVQTFAIQPLEAVEPNIRLGYLTEDPGKSLSELQAEADAFDESCAVDNVEPDCRLILTDSQWFPNGNGLDESLYKEQEYVYNGKTYRDNTVEFIENDDDFAGAYYTCEIEQLSTDSSRFECIPGTLTAVAGGTSLTNLPSTGTATYAGFYFGEVDLANSVIPATGTFDIVIALMPDATSNGSITGDGTVNFTGTVVVDNMSGLIGSADLEIRHNDVPKDGFMFGWLHGNGGTLVSGVIGTESTSEAGSFGFDALMAGVSTSTIDVTEPPAP